MAPHPHFETTLLFHKTLLEAFDTPGSIHEFLLAGEEGMAFGTDANPHVGTGGTCANHIATGASDHCVIVFRMDASFHGLFWS